MLAFLKQLQRKDNNCNITLHSSISKFLIKGDAHRIEQVIINFLTNAIQYAPGSDRIEVYISHEVNEIKVGVEDYGIGIVSESSTTFFQGITVSMAAREKLPGLVLACIYVMRS